MKRPFLTGFLALSLFFTWSCEGDRARTDDRTTATQPADRQDDDRARNDEKRREFVQETAQENLADIELAKLASKNARNSEVKRFAQQIVNERTEVYKELKDYADKNNIPVPEVLTDDGRQNIKNLAEKRGADFDREFMDKMVKQSRDLVQNLEDAREDIEDPELSAWIDRTLPTKRRHLEMAERTENLVQERRN